MAIIIPSKNIYEMNNPKIRDNVIDNVSVEQIITNKEFEDKITVHEEKVFNFQEESQEKIDFIWLEGMGKIYEASAYAKMSVFFSNFNVQIKKLLTNKYINKIYYGLKDDETPNINVSIKGTKSIYSNSATLIAKNSQNTISNYYITNYQEKLENKEIISYNLSDIENTTNEVIQTILTSNGTTSVAEAIIEYPNDFNTKRETNIDDESIFVDNTSQDLFELNGVFVLSGWSKTALKFSRESQKGSQQELSTKIMQGTREEYRPELLTITIQGDTIGIDLTDGSLPYGSGNKPHSLSGNELMQDSAKVNGVALTEHLANNVLSQYAKGKETATLLCSISDYYDEENAQKITANNFQIIGKNDYNYRVEDLPIGENDNGTMEYEHLAIIELNKPATTDILFSIGGVYVGIGIGGTVTTYSYIDDKSETPDFLKEIEIIRQEPKMTFEIGEEVIPMVFGANGKDQPMSKNQDGSAKVFEIIGINFIYDGAVWQELSLLEKLK